MKLLWGLLLGAMLFALPAHADTLVDYSLSVQDAPGGIGDFSWTLQTDGFITTPPPTAFQCIQYCDLSPEHWVRQCVANCNPGFYDYFLATSAPSLGGGCQISKVWLEPNYAPVTFFAPLCDGLYDAFSGGAFPDPGVLGTWTWNWDNYDGTHTVEMLTISEPPSVPTREPEEGGMLILGIGLLWLACRSRMRPGRVSVSS